MAGPRISGIALAAIGAGAVFAYAGLKGKSILSSLQGVIKGKAPSVATAADIITDPGSAAAGGGLPPPLAAGQGAYSNSQLRSLWIMGGGDPAKAPVAACIAQHESSGNPKATSGNPDGGTNVGLWQLDTPGGKGAGYSISQLMDPLTNARVAVQGSSNGTDWSAWSTAPLCGV